MENLHTQIILNTLSISYVTTSIDETSNPVLVVFSLTPTPITFLTIFQVIFSFILKQPYST